MLTIGCVVGVERGVGQERHYLLREGKVLVIFGLWLGHLWEGRGRWAGCG